MSWLATYLLHSTLLLGGTWLALRIARNASPRLREALWRTALFSGLATASLQVGLGYEPLGGRIALPEPAVSQEEPLREPPRTVLEPSASPAPASEPRGERTAGDTFPVHLVRRGEAPRRERAARPDSGDATAAPRGAAPVDDALVATARRSPEPSGRASRAVAWSAVVLAAWGLGALPGALALALAVRRLARGLGARRPLRHGLAPRLVDDLRRRAGVARPVHLSTCPGLDAPLTFGVLRPEVCLPERVLDLPEEELEALLAHELAHAVRFDPAWRIAARALSALFFFQPLNRVAARELEDTSEYLSDDWAVAVTGRGLALASCLTTVAAWLAPGRGAALARGPAPAMADGRRRLGRRVARLLDGGASARPAAARAVSALVFASVASLAPVLSARPASAPPVEPAPVRVAPAAPAVARDGVVRDAPSDVEGPALAAAALGSLERQLGELRAELERLERAAAGLGPDADLARAIAAIDDRVSELCRRRDLLERALARAVAAVRGAPHDPALAATTQPEPPDDRRTSR